MSNITLTSTTSSQEEMEHAAGPDWREPFIPKTVPAEQPAAKAEEAPEGQETEPEIAAASETAEDKQETAKKEKPKSRAQRAIDKLTARNYRLEKELDEARKSKTAETPSAPAQPSGPPKLDDFLAKGKTADEWADARDAWKESDSIRQAEEAERKAEFDEYNRGVSELRAKYDDFDDKMAENSEATIPRSVGNAIFEMGKFGAEVAYYLAQHPEICEELSEMKALAAVGKIHEIARSLKPSEKAAAPAEKNKAKPPEPIEPVGGSSTRSSVPLDEMPIGQFMKIRNKQERDRKGL